MSRAFDSGALSRTNPGIVGLELGRPNNVLSSGWTQPQIDFRSDDTNADYSLRFARGNTGPNAPSYFQHKGTGALNFIAADAGAIAFYTANTYRSAISAGGYFVTKYQPFFAASYDGTDTVSTASNIIWRSLSVNSGSHYSSTTGVFTAPVAGDYLFLFRVRLDFTAGGRTDIAFLKNGAAIPGAVFPLQKPASVSYSLHGTIIVSLAANDAISVKPTVLGPTVDASTLYNVFSGYFLG